MNTIVEDSNGQLVVFECAVPLMDDEIREMLNEELAPCSEQKFFTAYEQEHLKKFGVEFTV